MERPSLLVVLLFIVCDYYEIFTNKKGLKKIKNVNTIIINGFLLILYFNKKKKIMLHNKQGHGPLSHIKVLILDGSGVVLGNVFSN